MPWPAGGPSSFRIKSLARLLDGRTAKDFSGFVVKQNKILYRHGSYSVMLRTSTAKGKRIVRRYPRLNWSNAFDAGKSNIDFVLLHASEPRDRFFLIPEKEFAPLRKTFPAGRVNISAKKSDQDKYRLLIEPFEVSFLVLKRVLRKD